MLIYFLKYVAGLAAISAGVFSCIIIYLLKRKEITFREAFLMSLGCVVIGLILALWGRGWSLV